MVSSRMGKTGRTPRRAWWTGLAATGLLASIGCQAEYAGMTLPSGKYFYDDVQYFAPGPDFPLANTLAAQQRARMMAQGINPMGPAAGAPGTTSVVTPPPPAPGVVTPPPPAPGQGNVPADAGNMGGGATPPDVPPPGF